MTQTVGFLPDEHFSLSKRQRSLTEEALRPNARPMAVQSLPYFLLNSFNFVISCGVYLPLQFPVSQVLNTRRQIAKSGRWMPLANEKGLSRVVLKKCGEKTFIYLQIKRRKVGRETTQPPCFYECILPFLICRQ